MVAESIWSGFIVQSLVRGAIWIALVSAAALLARRGSAGQRALIWQAAFAGLAMLPFLYLVVPPIRLARPAVGSGYAASVAAPTAPLGDQSLFSTTADPSRGETSGNRPLGIETAQAGPLNAAGQAPDSLPSAPIAAPKTVTAISQATMGRALLLGWALGCFWCLVSMAAGACRLQWLAGRAVPAPDWLRAEMEAAVADLGSRQNSRNGETPILRSSGSAEANFGARRAAKTVLKIAAAEDALPAPITWGRLRPVVLLPTSYAADPTEGRGLGGHGGRQKQANSVTLPHNTRAALLHELAHVARGDWAWLIAVRLICALYWCVPLVWAAARRLRRETEMACDDAVLAAGAEPAAYAALLLDAAKLAAKIPVRTPQGALAMARPPFAEHRIRAVLAPQTRRTPPSRAGIVLAALLPAILVPVLAIRAVTAHAAAALRGGPPAAESAPPGSYASDSPVGTFGGIVSARRANPSRTPHTAAPDTASPQTTNPAAPGKGAESPALASDVVSDKIAGLGSPFLAKGSAETVLETTRIHWGAPVRGLQAGLAIHGDRRVFRVGENISTDLYWRNATNKKVVEITYAQYSPTEPLTEIQTASGGRVDVRITYIDIPPVSTAALLKPGEAVLACSSDLWLDAAKQNAFNTTAIVKPGKYRLRAMNFASPKGSAFPNGSQAKTAWIGVEILAPSPTIGGQRIGIGPDVTGVGIRSPQFSALRGQSQPVQDGRSAAWGPVIDGLRAGIRLESAQAIFAPGETIWQVCYLKNGSSRPVTISTSGGYEQQGRPLVKSADGTSVKVLQYFGMGAMFLRTQTINPGELAFVGRYATEFKPLDLSGNAPKEVAPGISSAAEDSALALTGPGSYELRQQIYPQFEGDKRTGGPVVTGPLRVRIAGPAVLHGSGRQNTYLDLKTAPVAWGPVQSGLQAGLIALEPRQRYFEGERVRFATILRNVSQTKISFWHETSFAFLDPPILLDAGGRTVKYVQSLDVTWSTLSSLHMTGVTFDMTYAPSSDGPSRLRQTEIDPGQSVVGYGLTSFIVPNTDSSGRAAVGRFRVMQTLRVGLGQESKLDIALKSGELNLDFSDPGPEVRTR